jgi:hypothetical protein
MEILVLAAIALALFATVAVAALKLLVWLVFAPFELIGGFGAVAAGLAKLVVALGAACLIGAAITLVLVLLPVAAFGALAIALVF